jgi:hypothetical protein
MMKRLCAAVLAAAALGAGAARADDLVWDYGPGTGTLNNAWSNESDGTHWADAVTLAQTATITGYTYYSDFDLSGETASDAFQLQIYADAGGQPGDLLVSESVGFSSASSYTTFWMPTIIGDDGAGPIWDVEEFGMQTLQFDIPAFRMEGGTTYWIGLSGNGFEAAQWSIDGPGDGAMAEFWGPDFLQIDLGIGSDSAFGDQMFQLSGTTETDLRALSTPEPGGPALWALGLAAVAVGLARRARIATP